MKSRIFYIILLPSRASSALDFTVRISIFFKIHLNKIKKKLYWFRKLSEANSVTILVIYLWRMKY